MRPSTFSAAYFAVIMRRFWIGMLLALAGCGQARDAAVPAPAKGIGAVASAPEKSTEVGKQDASAARSTEDSTPSSAPEEERQSSEAKPPSSASLPTEAEASPIADSTSPPRPTTGEQEEQEEAAPEDAGPREGEGVLEPANPFPHRLPIEEFPQGVTWLNTSAPLDFKELRGKFVLLDFWTYCCINCMHVLPELKKVEKEFPKTLVVIGVHSAKFDTEKGTENIEAAILRYGIEHPVVNDSEHKIWQAFGARSWPTLMLIDPEGYLVAKHSGEFRAEDLRPLLREAMDYYRGKGLLRETPLKLELLANKAEPTELRFPGKILADESQGRLFIVDSNHHRILVTTLAGQVLGVIGGGEKGRQDGDYEKASFHHPQGVALHGHFLYVADTENHLLRKVDLQAKKVATIAGTGEQGRNAWPGAEKLTAADDLPQRWVGPPATTAINSPWDLHVHQDQLYIAMAGPHQIWKMPLDESELGPYAGNGREDVVDGPRIPRVPYEMGYSSFAQPSGLTSDGTWLYVADSEGSSIRAVPFDPDKEVRTLVGTQDLPFNRLFTFGDQDGPRETARLQHPLGVAYHEGKVYVADTYNNKIRVVDAQTGETSTLAGTGKAGRDDQQGAFDEPAGLSIAAGVLFVADTNNHLIRTVDLTSGKVGTLKLSGLPGSVVKPTRAEEPSAAQENPKQAGAN